MNILHSILLADVQLVFTGVNILHVFNVQKIKLLYIGIRNTPCLTYIKDKIKTQNDFLNDALLFL